MDRKSFLCCGLALFKDAAVEQAPPAEPSPADREKEFVKLVEAYKKNFEALACPTAGQRVPA